MPNTPVILAALIATAAFAVPANVTPLQTEEPPSIASTLVVKSVIGCGGGTRSLGAVSIRGTFGQSVASVATGAALSITSGFWAPSIATTFCLGDANRDGVVNFNDVGAVLSNYSASGAQPLYGDANGSGIVDFSDISAVLAALGIFCD